MELRVVDGDVWRQRSPFDWDAIADGQTYLITKVRDLATFRRGAYQAAKIRGLRAKTRVDENGSGVFVQFYADDGDDTD